MNALQLFGFNSYNFRALLVNDEPWFVAKDLADLLGYSDTQAMTRRLDDDEMDTFTDISSGQGRSLKIINESGMYCSILGSKKEEAKKFKKWVTKTVLPSIRKTGSYQIDQLPYAVNNELQLVEATARMLKVNDASKLLMLQNASKRMGIDPVGLLPDYTEEKVTIPLTALIKKNGIKITTVKANKILIEKEILEVKERQGRKAGVPVVKKFKAFTEKGLEYGKNLMSPQNQRETQCHFYPDVDIKKLLEV